MALVAYHKTRKDGAVGVDGQTAGDYEAGLMGNLRASSPAPSPARTWPLLCECAHPQGGLAP